MGCDETLLALKVKLNSPLCWFYDANHGFPDSWWTSTDNPDKKQIQNSNDSPRGVRFARPRELKIKSILVSSINGVSNGVECVSRVRTCQTA